ncbi:unnamed protein product [Heterobilharzia americana]|nr:unnamed protein product [Heterobilharzia americana]
MPACRYTTIMTISPTHFLSFTQSLLLPNSACLLRPINTANLCFTSSYSKYDQVQSGQVSRHTTAVLSFTYLQYIPTDITCFFSLHNTYTSVYFLVDKHRLRILLDKQPCIQVNSHLSVCLTEMNY